MEGVILNNGGVNGRVVMNFVFNVPIIHQK